MELIDTRSNSVVSIKECAEQVMAVVPAVMTVFRTEMRAGKPAELSVPQFRALLFLRRQPGASVSNIADHLGLALSTTSQLVDGLVKRQYITRETAAGDRRRAILALTTSGKKMLKTVRANAQARMEERLAALTPEERQAVNEAMQALGRIFQRTEQGE